jgi:rubrerythrin
VELVTASAVMSFARKLEEDSARFYEEIVATFNRDPEVFMSFVKENRRNIAQAERAYYGVISDALEGCFSFRVDTSNYEIVPVLGKTDSFLNAIKQALEIEKTIRNFYTDAATQSKPFLADVPRVFQLLVKIREQRRAKLESYLVGEA